jgi:RimJ/RimL family protein N-acetyltransferase
MLRQAKSRVTLAVNYSIRKLEENDWHIFSEVRLLALRTDPKVFGSTHEREAGFSEAEWRSQLTNRDTGIFAVFDENGPVGMTGVAVDRDDPSRKTALLWGSWLSPDARGKGLSRLLYEARLSWARNQPGVEQIIVSHRESNVASKFANQRFGFHHTHTTERKWNDGVIEKELHYELIL